jgi:hypothetical protein
LGYEGYSSAASSQQTNNCVIKHGSKGIGY